MDGLARAPSPTLTFEPSAPRNCHVIANMAKDLDEKSEIAPTRLSPEARFPKDLLGDSAKGRLILSDLYDSIYLCFYSLAHSPNQTRSGTVTTGRALSNYASDSFLILMLPSKFDDWNRIHIQKCRVRSQKRLAQIILTRCSNMILLKCQSQRYRVRHPTSP